MVLNPCKIHVSDPDWKKALAFMQVLPLDPRKPPAIRRDKRYDPARNYFDREYFVDADSFLTRPNVYRDNRWAPAPYFCYRIQFNVAVCVIGTIRPDSAYELQEFRDAVNASMNSPLSIAERDYWMTHSELLRETSRCHQPVNHAACRGVSVEHDLRVTELKVALEEFHQTANEYYNRALNAAFKDRELSPLSSYRDGVVAVAIATLLHSVECRHSTLSVALS